MSNFQKRQGKKLCLDFIYLEKYVSMLFFFSNM